MKRINLTISVIFVGLSLSIMGCQANSDASSDKHSKTHLAPHYSADHQEGMCCTVIAHAGGAIDGNAYTNSQEAVLRNYGYGTRMFELDFEQTRDGEWVAAHDWPNWKLQTGFKGEIPPSLTEYMSTPRFYKKISWSIEGTYTPIDMTWLEGFLSKNADAFIVTDMKALEKFPEFVDTILSHPKKEQFIFQAYSIDDVELIKARAPDTKIILTMYRIGYPAALFTQLKEKKEDLIGVTVPMSWAHIESVTTRLLETDIPIYLHGAPANINSRGLQADFAAKGISGFYLD